MNASIIITTKNNKDFHKKAFPILLKQNFKGDYEIIVIDSGSTDGSIEYLESLPIKLIKIPPETFNYGIAFNLAAKTAKGKYLVKLSGDVIPIGKRWLTEITIPFKNLEVGGTYGRYTITGRKGYGYPDFWPAEAFPSKITKYSVKPTPFMGVNLFGIEFGDDKVRDEVFNFAGGCCAIRKKIWQQRPFNEKMLGGEDAEYSWFLHIIGYDIVCNPKAKAIHEHKLSGSMGNSFWASRGVSTWQWVFNWHISKYWLQKMLFIDPYKKMRND